MKQNLLKLTLAIAFMVMVAAPTMAEILTGSCGDNAIYILNTETGLLKIGGSGKMKDYSSNSPWYSYRSSITKAEISNEITSIGNYAFYRCSNLTSVTIGNSVTSIGQYAFSECPTLTSANIPNSVTLIGLKAFYKSSGLTSVTIGNSVTAIGERAFADCSGIESIIVDKANEYFDSRDDCNAIIKKSTNSIRLGCKNTTIPNSIKSIGEDAFYGCSGLTSVTIPSSVTYINSYAFYKCSGLTSVTIPNSVTGIGEAAFEGCSGLTSVSISNSIKYISYYAFRDCSSLTSVTIPNSVTSIGGWAFKGCSSLISVIIPNSVTEMQKGVFQICSALTSVTISNSITSIKESSFEGCSALTSVTIPNSVTKIDNYAFSGCSNLIELTCEAVTPPSLTPLVFSNVPVNKGILYVPVESIDAYKNAELWKDWSIIMAMVKKDVKIESIAFGEANMEIMNGTSGKFDVTILPADASNKALQWVSTNTAVLTIDSDGYYTAKALGNTTVMAISQDGSGKSAMCNVTVVSNVFAINDNAKEFAVESEHKHVTISYTRTYNGKWEALYLPFSLNVTAIADEYDVAEIYDIHQYDENYDNNPDYTILEIKQVTSGQTEPNTPYLIRAKSTGEKVMTQTDATVYPTVSTSLDCSSVKTKYTFIGTYIALETTGIHTIQDGELQASGSVSPFRWYMRAVSRKGEPAYLPVRIKVLTVDDVVTGVDIIKADKDAPTYNLSGQKLSTKPTQRGIYIHQGKRILVK